MKLHRAHVFSATIVTMVEDILMDAHNPYDRAEYQRNGKQAGQNYFIP